MVVVYGKNNCQNCVEIKKKLESLNINFEYIKDDDKIMEIARELNSKGKLIETLAPIVLSDGVQIKHKDINTLRKD